MDELRDLQLRIEEMTTRYDDPKNLYQEAPDILRRLVGGENNITAKEYIKNSRLLSNKELYILYYLDEYTLEGIMLHTLASLFNSFSVNPAVLVSTLISHLDNAAKTQSKLLQVRKKAGAPPKGSPLEVKKPDDNADKNIKEINK